MPILISLVLITAGAALRQYRARRWAQISVPIVALVSLVVLCCLGFGLNNTVVLIAISLLVGVFAIDIFRGMSAYLRQPRAGAYVLAAVVIIVAVAIPAIQQLTLLLIFGALGFRLLLAPLFRRGGGGGGGGGRH